MSYSSRLAGLIASTFLMQRSDGDTGIHEIQWGVAWFDQRLGDNLI